MTVKEVLQLESYRSEAPVFFAARQEGFAEFWDHEAVPEKYLNMEALGYEYRSEGDGNHRHDTLWIDVEEV